MNVSVNVLAKVTAGFANEVDDVNQYPAVINKATEIATLDLLFFLTIKIVKINPNDAIISLKNMFFSEIIASFGLILTILMVRKNNKSNVAISVALFITAGYWFTSSTSFANPAVTLARTFTDTFTGISPESIVYFFSGQLVGLFIAFHIYKFLR